MKHTIRMTVIAVLITLLTAGQALAGSGARHRLEGVLIGTGVAILGAAILGAAHGPGRDVYAAPPDCRRYEGGRNMRVTMGSVWVPPVYEERWVPGHYVNRGYWVPGHRERVLIQDGYWEQRRMYAPY
ncbi:MAG: hypothetical protein V1793_24620 [Pseudomonadota bacterium]